jgi:hypothetical protein
MRMRGFPKTVGRRPFVGWFSATSAALSNIG